MGNFNHLPKHVSKEFIAWITSVAINAKRINAKDTYGLYHSYMRDRIPQVVRFAYRTYFTKKIKNAKKISRGLFEVKNFLWKLRKTFRDEDFKLIKKKLHRSLAAAKDEKKQDSKVMRFFRMFKEGEVLTEKEARERAEKYFEEIKKVRRPSTIDRSRYTIL